MKRIGGVVWRVFGFYKGDYDVKDKAAVAVAGWFGGCWVFIRLITL